MSPASSRQPSRVLMVCRGNMCRSPLAAALLTRAEAFGPGAQIDSAGLQAVVGSDIDPILREVSADIDGLDFTGFEARQITPDLIAQADLVLTMTVRQRYEVLELAPEAMARTHTLNDYAALIQHQRLEVDSDPGDLRSTDTASDISDPHRRGPVAMRRAALEITRAVESITGRLDPEVTRAFAGSAPLRVLSSSPRATDTTSPYLVLLTEALEAEDGIEILPFSWRRAMFSRIDVYHSHWPEAALAGATRIKTWVRRLMFLVMLANFRRTAIVQTMHNLAPHESPSRINRWLLARFHRRVAMRISINDTTPATPGPPISTIVHGHYREWFSRYAPIPAAAKNALIFFGLIRRYKGVDTLLSVFAKTEGDLHLTVAGRADPAELVGELEALAAADERVELDLRFIPEGDLVARIGGSSLAVLAYRELHNSGAAITALSLNRPVLVPANSSTDALAREVGEDWIMRFKGELTPEILQDAARRAPGVIASGTPDLRRRDWTLAGTLHAAVFREAVMRRNLRSERNR